MFNVIKSTMDSEDSDKVPSGESEEVVKDSTIQVTVDDLQPGIIVVSFSHKKSLYQGVLLQLDRNRGLPCGISFPKSFMQDSQDVAPKEVIAVEMPPLNKRQTYFQRDLLNDPTSAVVDTHSKFPTLRRNIKPPARYKNSRMNLRVRNRPVLCAKCQTLCEDKGQPPTNENGDEESTKKLLSGVSTRRNPGKGNKSEETSGSVSLVDTASTKLGDDYKYSSYGQRGVISNYWRRPNGIVDDKLRSGGTTVSGAGSSKSHTQQLEPKICIKPISTVNIPKREMVPVTKVLRVENTGQTILSDSNLPTWPLMPILSSPNDSSSMSSRSKKSKNLKLCISKLTMSKCDKIEPKIVTTLCKETERVTRSTAALIQENECEQFNLKLKDCNKNWNSRIRKRSTVPARFRDESYLTKNIFKFKRRRVDEKPGEVGKMPIYTSRLVSSDNEDTTNERSPVNEKDQGEGTKDDFVCYSDTSGNASSSSSSGSSSLNTSNGNGHGDVKSEPAKTPVIKITFGSSGNGIVVQIPPKTTQEESSGSPESKAARKAMKKAKKEARRKVSMSREPSPTPKPTVSPQYIQDNFPDSPLPPVLNPEYPITPLNDESESLLCDRGPPPVEPMEPLRYIPKRKKKEKKKKRSKVSKENDLNSDNGTNAHPPDSQRQINHQDSLEQIRILRNSEALPPLEDEPSFQCNKQRDSETEENHTNHNEAHQRLFLSLKRLDENMYCKIACPTLVNDTEENSDSSEISEVTMEPYEYPSNGYEEGSAESLDFYCFEETDHTYRKGDIIWGKLPECPWWPGKIEDILFTDADDVRAKITWYKSEVSSYIQFDSIAPFAGTFDAMYTKQRNRGEYQEAVRDALLEAHEMSPKHIPAE